MPKWLKHGLVAAAAIVAAVVPAVLADPAVQSMVANHPWVALYLPVVSAAIVALYHALIGDRNGDGNS